MSFILSSHIFHISNNSVVMFNDDLLFLLCFICSIVDYNAVPLQVQDRNTKVKFLVCLHIPGNHI